MALLDWMQEPSAAIVEGEGISLRSPRLGDHADWAALREESRAYLQPWEPSWPDDDLSRAAFRRRLQVYARELELGHAWPFFIFGTSDKRLVGAVTLSNVRRGAAETGTLGYWIGQPYAGRGYATAAVRCLVDYAFHVLKLHRVEASCLPTNLASRKVLNKAGFVQEGHARAYLKINGAWADHLLFGIVNDDVRQASDEPSSKG